MCLNAIAISFGWMATTWPGESPTNADFITYWRALRGSVPPRLCCRSSRHGKIHESSVEQSSKRKSRCPFATSEWISRLVTFLSFYFVNFSFFFFLAKTVVKMRATIVFWTHGLIKSHSRVKIIYTVSYILSVYLKNIDWEEWEENVYKSRRSKKLWTSNFLSPPADKFKLTDFIEIESINIFLLFSQFCQIKNEYFKLIESLWERVSISEMYFLYSCLLIINRLFGRGLKLVGLTYQTRDFGLCENKKVFLYKIDVDF